MLPAQMAEDDLRQRRSTAYETARPDVQRLVPATAHSVLDLGCASGALGAALKQGGVDRVVGVELDRALAADARSRLDAVVEGDLSEALASSELSGEYDCVIAADVLEHLADPWAALRAATALLAPGGIAIVSLPNVRYFETLVSLGVRGRWPRADHGVFDRTHLQWFTLADARELLAGTGLDVVHTEPRYPCVGWRLSVARGLGRIGLTQFLATQNILVGRRA